MMGEQTKADVVSMRLADGEAAGRSRAWRLDVIYTPGHTDDSYSFAIWDDRVFTGDTLLIRGTGRTDFQNGDSRAQYESLQRLMRLPEETLVFPAHDYKGDTVSTIGEEKRFNPRLKVRDADEYAALMASLQPAESEDDGRGCSRQHPSGAASGGGGASRAGRSRPQEAKALVGRPDVALIDLREKARARADRRHSGVAARALTPSLQDNIGEGGLHARAGAASGKTLGVLLRLRRALRHGGAGRPGSVGIASARHIEGGMAAWTKAGGAAR